MARKFRQGRSRKTTKKNKDAEEKPLEKEAETKVSAECVKNDQDENVKSAEGVSPPQTDVSDKETRATERVETQSKKRKYEPDAEDEPTTEDVKKFKDSKPEMSNRIMAIRIERW